MQRGHWLCRERVVEKSAPWRRGGAVKGWIAARCRRRETKQGGASKGGKGRGCMLCVKPAAGRVALRPDEADLCGGHGTGGIGSAHLKHELVPLLIARPEHNLRPGTVQ